MSKSYIEFKLIEQKPKTNVYAVINKNFRNRIGIIKWHPAWRQYCFYPAEETIFSRGCMEDINKNIQELMEERKQQKEGEIIHVQ